MIDSINSIKDRRSEIVVDRVCADLPVGFSVTRYKNIIFGSYYALDKQMRLFKYDIDKDSLSINKINQKLEWDAHNRVSVAVDKDGFIHLSGNMHKTPLIYYRSTKPLGIKNMIQSVMTGECEDSCTYPMFFKDSNGNLLFMYRNGKSGRGETYINKYNLGKKKWVKLLDVPLFDGEGAASSYPTEIIRSSDGYYHVAWVWRDSPDCSTNHDLSYAKTKDFINWVNIVGDSISVPFTRSSDTCIDSMPIKSGIINGGVQIGFDEKSNPLVSYHKYDGEGNTQAFIAHFVGEEVISSRISNWDYRWNLDGGGTIPIDIKLGAPEIIGSKINVEFEHLKYGKGIIEIDKNTFLPVAQIIKSTTGDKPGRLLPKFTISEDKTCRLDWLTLPANRDQKREGDSLEPGGSDLALTILS